MLHHVEARTIVMNAWLRDDIDNKVPPFPHTQVGAAGLCLNDKNEILLIKEWTGGGGNRTGSKQWKLPGGLVDRGESFQEAAVREVFEETGIEAEYESLLSLWQRHDLAPFGVSDMYAVAFLKPKGEGIINIDPVEISACKWMKVSEFCKEESHPLISLILRDTFGLPLAEIKRAPSSETESIIAATNARFREGKRIAPKTVMKEHDVQFGTNRPAIPTLLAVGVDDGGNVEEGGSVVS